MTSVQILQATWSFLNSMVKPYVSTKNMSDRVSFTTCYFMKDNLPAYQDGALLFNIIHGFTPEQNTALLKKIYNSFNKSAF
jgi:hypothetical protein